MTERREWGPVRRTDPTGALVDAGARFRVLVPEIDKALEDLENARSVLGTSLDRECMRPHAVAFLEAADKVRALLA